MLRRKRTASRSGAVVKLLILGLVLLGLNSFAYGENRVPLIGDKITDLKFKDIRGLPRNLNDLGAKRAYVFVFTTTQCPLVNRSIPKLNDLDLRFGHREVQFVAVNVSTVDTIREMAAQAIDFEATFPFVKDVNFSCVRALGVERTPEVVILDANRTLVYRGRIDDQLRLGGTRPEPTRRDLEEALNELLEDRTVSVAETPTDGCLIQIPDSSFDDRPALTFYKDVAPILNQRCVGCHRPEASAPFALTTFLETASHAEMLVEVVADQRMPPWYANPKHGTFQNDTSLSRDEREVLIRWVKCGCREGDPQDAPPDPESPKSKWRIGEPDVVITMLDEHKIPATGFVPYKRFLLPHLFFSDTWIEAVEIRPDNPAVVHHANMAYVTTKGASEKTFITGHVPGGQPMDLGRFKEGIGLRVPSFASLGMEVHYTTTGKEERCKISVGLRFPRRTVHKQLKHFLLDPRQLQIAAGNGAFPVRSAVILDQDATMLGLFAHMHLRGKDVTFFAEAPNQPREILLQIPNYNFDWQMAYEFAPGTKRLPQGTRIEAVVHYDNSAFNPYNPDPTRTVPYGLQTFDEMFNGYGFYVANEEDLNLTVNPKTGVATIPKLPKSN